MSKAGRLGRTYADGDVVCAQGELGDCVYVVQEGELEIVGEREGTGVTLGVARKGALLGEMAMFLGGVRSATVRARGPARVLTIDKHTLLRRVSEDPTVAFRLIETMAGRIRELDRQVLELVAVLERQRNEACAFSPGVT